jgi:hypothetical protein
MTEPSRRGRRDNGLAALEYVPLADVDPRIGDHLLDILWAAGIPAYLEPPPDSDPTRRQAAATQPVDRLWVDGERRTDARALVEAEAAELPGEPAKDGTLAADEQAAWDELVAQFDDDDSGHPWPVAEDLDVPTTAPPQQPTPAQQSNQTPGNLLDAIDALDGLSADDEGHYEPPPPPPMPRLSKYAVLALGLVAGGLALLFVPWFGDSGGIFAVGVAAIICGVALLIWRVKEDRDDGPDDGAVV